MPKLLAYPDILSLSERPELKGMYVYLIKAYQPGKSILMKREGGEVGVTVGDWRGNAIECAKDTAVTSLIHKLGAVMATAGVKQGQFFLDNKLQLVDLQLSINKFVGAGFLRDLFAKVVPTQEVIEVTHLLDDKIAAMAGQNIIVKPVRYRATVDNKPLYARL